MHRREREKIVEVPVCNPSTWKAETGGCQAHARMDYIVKPCLKVGRGIVRQKWNEKKGPWLNTNKEGEKEMDDGHGPSQEDV